MSFSTYIISMIKNIYNYDTNGLKLPTSCPCCGGDLEIKDNGMVKCINPNCKQKVSHKIFQFLIALEIKGAGPSYVDDATKDVKNLSEFIGKLVKDDEASIKWAGGVNGKKVADRVRKALKKEITLAKFISCFDIEGIAEGQIKKVCKANPDVDINFFLKPTSMKQFLCHGVGEETAKKMYEGLLDRTDEMQESLQYFNLAKAATEPKVEGGKLAGLSFCFTGAAVLPRKELEKLVAENGGEVTSVKKGLSYLVTDDTESGSAKNKKAKELGIPVITSTAFIEMTK